MKVRLLMLALVSAPTLGGCAAVAVTGAVVGGTAKIATTAVGATVGATTTAVGLVVPGSDDDEAGN
ncbi:hypothetical protein C8N35_102168 [Breoghania corrubedonensis]|uniref:Lipoprotein n=1 Tax=Breoghania corrubedonensis TaxID=665038 RepID=A0A2T5VCI8_9HYPH|nr:hypothetical protein [Breoghania corrubedonensis]PTW61458.1 hypothetical protein C8N35_102168 [Breoghania corrubedonensis]